MEGKTETIILTKIMVSINPKSKNNVYNNDNDLKIRKDKKNGNKYKDKKFQNLFLQYFSYSKNKEK